VTLIGAWLASSAHLPIVGTLGIWAFLIFPDGRLLGRRWALAGVVATIGAAAVSVAIALAPGGLLWYPTVDNTFAAPASATSGLFIVGIAGGLLFVVGLLAAGVSIIVRYRRSRERGRLQLRWIAFAVVLLTVTAAPFLLVRYVMPVPYEVASVLAGVLILTAGTFPLTAAIAILRYRLLDIDLILNRTIVYVPLSAILAGLFGALATLVQRIFVAVTGDTSDIAIVLATVMIALTVTPLQRALQELADHYVKPTVKAGGGTLAVSAATSIEPSGAAGAATVPTAPAELDATLHRIVEELEELEERIEELEPRRPAPRSSSHRPNSAQK
jgi:two-component system NarL family sensor kinase